MKVRASEFARMCGVTRMAVCSLVKRGSLVRVGKFMDTEDVQNRKYLEKHSIPASEETFDIFSEQEADFCCSKEGRQAIEACRTVMRYIVNVEKEIAANKEPSAIVADDGTMGFMRFLVQRLQLNGLDEQVTHDGILMAMKPEYRLAYLRSVSELKK